MAVSGYGIVASFGVHSERHGFHGWQGEEA